ncbi:hypothetical protein LCGC14_1821400 [marine sediment metagenome]|uniref:Uncharacterized protein n=1 Tax=marine sediment metagenome TaxID=412755 RepID=A0A0F9GIS9_9ZZZZ
MSSGLSPFEKRAIAEKFLHWLSENSIKDWPNTYSLIVRAADALDEEVYNLWKAYDLLVILGRLERISPNGRKGCRVLCFTPLTKPVPSDAILCNKKSCPILKQIGEIFNSQI